MSLPKLLELDERRAFEATHRYEDLDLFHVSFDELTGGEATERALGRMAGSAGRVSLVGPSGSGKSSVICSVLGPLVEGLPEHALPMRIPVAAAGEETVTDPRAFAQHVVRTVVRYASPEALTQSEQKGLEAGVADVKRRRRGEGGLHGSFGLPAEVLGVGLAADLKSGGEEIEERLGAGDVVPELARMIAIFRSHGRDPFLVIDDSDTWLQIGATDLTAVADAFFTRVLRMLAKELDCGFVVAVHDHYLELAGYREIRPFLSTEIRIPRVDPAVDGVRRILARRVMLADVEAEVDELFETEALTTVAAMYEGDQNLRRVLATVDRSVQHACSDGAAMVTPELVRTVFAELA